MKSRLCCIFHVVDKFNSNIGCIEIVTAIEKEKIKELFNSNIGCIEIGGNTHANRHLAKFNSNIGCIEISLVLRQR